MLNADSDYRNVQRMDVTPGGRLAWIVRFLLLVSGICGTTVAATVPEDNFSKSMDTAMARMDRDMMQPSSGDADRDFAAMMIPHHQGAIDMAKAELRYGHDPVLRRLAQGIVVKQQQEIVVMQQALAALPKPAVTKTSPPQSMKMEH